ncbi:MAG TPA: hypothetical protein VHD90_14045, partial [Phototrophicaceae bacterium]|nr:hypothetical protein [Phototrophicaceae bacterium]
MNLGRVSKLPVPYRLVALALILIILTSMPTIAQEATAAATPATVGATVTLNPSDPSLVTYYISDG